MSNLNNRLKKIETWPGMKEEHICKIFVRMAPGEKSEEEIKFFRDHQTDLDKCNIMIITWHDPNAINVGD
ncbi:MAG: hypothetical protein GY839_18840 [candidate division Zixibacteria bacterium]|nr:hypothetical protein [candidate division Zixibacteria bacterium]